MKAGVHRVSSSSEAASLVGAKSRRRDATAHDALVLKSKLQSESADQLAQRHC
jgi:hypothetical protein